MAQGDVHSIRAFTTELRRKKPRQSVIDEFRVTELPGHKPLGTFEIRKSRENKSKNTRIAPDLCICEDCLRELLNPRDRRYFYPFINCTNCGPRYTIVRDVPYDRKFTTMRGFAMCESCAAEYEDPLDRRFHAQPNACFTCGPRIELYSAARELILRGADGEKSRELIEKCAGLLRSGHILAVKGIGGFHLACDARNQETVSRLRSLKYREQRPFALMVKDVRQARMIVRVGAAEKKRLLAEDRPIVVLRKKHKKTVAPSVSPDNGFLGIMLPYAPLHFLLFTFIDFPLVMTSGNLSDEPIAHTNQDAFTRLGKLCDYFLVGNRDIHIRCDDTVTRVRQGKEYILRRSRGIVPNPVLLNENFHTPILALGAEQKNTICLAKHNKAFLSHHIGDLKNAETYASFLQAVRHLGEILDIRPQAVAHDLHPQYLSTQAALQPPETLGLPPELPRIGVQHHHAHVAACMAEHNLRGPVIGVALDGTGYGSDGTVWGGEVLTADLTGFTRSASIMPFALPGADKVISQPWRTALSLLYRVYGDAAASYAARLWPELDEKALAVVLFQLEGAKAKIMTSSCGRLFDAVSALAGVCGEANYEGQPAVELEQAIEKDSLSGYTLDISRTAEYFELDWRELVAMVTADRLRGKSRADMAVRFHRGLVTALTGLCILVSEQSGIRRVVLSGGCFMNMYLLSGLTGALRKKGMEVYTHHRVPCNDGGIALGQAVIANQRVKEK